VEQIVCESRSINFGMDMKFEEDPFHVRLHGLMEPKDYAAAIRYINKALEGCRATTLDHGLLLMGPALLPLIPWATRNKDRKRARRIVLENCVNEFNQSHPELFMRWQTRPIKQLTIMRNKDAIILASK
jgi:hypothetical protein